MASYNRVILLGNLTRDPEIRYIPSGTPVCDIGLAVNDRRKGPQGDWVEETTYVDVTLWSRTAEVASEYLSKGSPVLIEGRLKLDSWETNDGQKTLEAPRGLRTDADARAARKRQRWRRRWRKPSGACQCGVQPGGGAAGICGQWPAPRPTGR